jgi:hypothetical protein
MSWFRNRFLGMLALAGLLWVAGCESYGTAEWPKRIGTYSLDDAVKELGPPERQATTTDGFTVGQWLVARSRVYSRTPGMWGWSSLGSDVSSTPDLFLQLTFGKDGRLTAWKRVQK